MCQLNYAHHPCQHTTYYGYHPCPLARHTRILCIVKNSRDPKPPPTIHVPPYPPCSNPTHTPPTLATIPSPFSNPTHTLSHPDTLLLTTPVSRLDFTENSNAPTATSAIRPKPTSDYPFPHPVGFGTHGAAFGLDNLMDGGFRLPPPPTAKLQYMERTTTTHILKVGARCRACEKEGEGLEEGERRWTMGQRFWLREGRERRERQRLLMGMVEGLREWMGDRKLKRGEGVEDLVRGKEWWGGGVTEMGVGKGKGKEKEKEMLVTEEEGERNIIVEGGQVGVTRRQEGGERNSVAESGNADAEKRDKQQWRRFFKSKQPPGTVEGGGVFSGFHKVGHSGNMWRWDGGSAAMDMNNTNGANLNLEIPDLDVSRPELGMEAAVQDEMSRQGMDSALTEPAVHASEYTQGLDNGSFPDRRISEGGVVLGEDDSMLTVSSTLAHENDTTPRHREGSGMWGGDDAVSVLKSQMMDIPMGEVADTSLGEGMDAFVRAMLVDSGAGAGRRVGVDGLVETVIRHGHEVDRDGARVTDNTWSEFDEDEAVERDDDSGSEYEPSKAE